MYDIAIIGGGVTGASTLYVLSKYTNVKDIILFEKYPSVAQVNSAVHNNSQTLHFGDIETNYSPDKAERVKEAAELVRAYVEKHDPKQQTLFKKPHKMVLAVGKAECAKLEKRYKEIKNLFPNLQKIGVKELAKVEPLIVKGRNPTVPLLALYTKDGYTINFEALSQSFIEETEKTGKARIVWGEKIEEVKRGKNKFVIHCKSGRKAEARVIIVAAGAHSLIFAKKMGYGKEYGILPVAGSFYRVHNVLQGKVYTMQIPQLPFAAVHGDPVVTNLQETRFGPTAKVLPLLERHHYKTIPDFIQTSVFTIDGIISLIKIIADPIIFRFVLHNLAFDIPFLGKYFYLQQVRKIVPSVRYGELMKSTKIGGIRPQVVNTRTKKLELDEAKIIEKNIIFDITPSPGASVCLKNAENNTLKVMEFLGKNYKFDQKKFRKEHLP